MPTKRYQIQRISEFEQLAPQLIGKSFTVENKMFTISKLEHKNVFHHYSLGCEFTFSNGEMCYGLYYNHESKRKLTCSMFGQDIGIFRFVDSN